MLASALKQASASRTATRATPCARYHWRRFRIDDGGHDDWEGTRSKQEPRTIQIRFSRVPESMVDALLGVRAIERQFGRIRDYRLLRDSEICSEYQAICWAAFESPKSLLRVPPQGTTLKVALPPERGRPEGGLGLDDLKSLLVPEDHGKPNSSGLQGESPSPARFVILNIKRAAAPITFRSTVKPPFRSRAAKAAIGHAFLEWGGFAPLEPLYASSPYTSPAVEHPPLDSINMRMALNKWCQILDVTDPLVPEMEQPLHKSETRKNDAEGDWEPLSEPLRMPDMDTDVAERFEMSRGAQESLRQSLEALLQRSSASAGAHDQAQDGEK